MRLTRQDSRALSTRCRPLCPALLLRPQHRLAPALLRAYRLPRDQINLQFKAVWSHCPLHQAVCKVQVGAFDDRESAEVMAGTLKRAGYADAWVTSSVPHRVQVGAYPTRTTPPRLSSNWRLPVLRFTLSTEKFAQAGDYDVDWYCPDGQYLFVPAARPLRDRRRRNT